MNKRFFWFFIAVLCVFLSCLCVNYDYDFFARLIVGERFIEDGILPFKDFLSFTPTHPWYDHEWGSSVVFYAILKLIGPIGILLFHSIMVFLTTFFVVKTQRLQKHAYPVSILFTITFILLYTRLNYSLIRCHLFSFLFFSLFIYILEKERKQGTKLLWLIPPVVIIWNNLHGGVVAGLGLIFMYLLGELLNGKPWKKYLVILAISCPLLIINPYGIKYLKFLFSATTMNRKYINEWFPFFRPPYVFYYIYPALFIIFGFSLNIINTIKKRNLDYTKLIILLVSVVQSLWHIKLLSLGLIAVCALCYNDIYRIFIRLRKFLKPVEKSCYYVIILLAFSIPLYSPNVPRADFNTFPLYEVEFLKLNNIKGNIVVPFGMGSYVSYKLYPDNLIYMDGRYEEVYFDKEFDRLRLYEFAEKGWWTMLDDYGIDILMPNKTNLVYEVLKTDPNWEHIFDGRLCGIFVPKKKVKKSYIEPDYHIDYYRRTMFKSTTFGKKIK